MAFSEPSDELGVRGLSKGVTWSTSRLSPYRMRAERSKMVSSFLSVCEEMLMGSLASRTLMNCA